MPSFAEKARKAQEEKRAAAAKKDPADLSGAQEPDWDNPATWGGSAESASGNESENASDHASAAASAEAERQEQPAKAAASSRPAARAPRRTGRPRGPERRSLGTRILLRHDRQLTVAVEQLGVNPQTVVDQALEMFFKKHKIEDPGEKQGQEDGVA